MKNAFQKRIKKRTKYKDYDYPAAYASRQKGSCDKVEHHLSVQYSIQLCTKLSFSCAAFY